MADCIFCQIVNKEIKADIVYQNDNFIAFTDINPQAPVHILIIPKKHYAVAEMPADLLAAVVPIAQLLATEKGVDNSGYRLLVNSGPDAGQEVEHVHWHFLAGKKLGPIA